MTAAKILRRPTLRRALAYCTRTAIGAAVFILGTMPSFAASSAAILNHPAAIPEQVLLIAGGLSAFLGIGAFGLRQLFGQADAARGSSPPAPDSAEIPPEKIAPALDVQAALGQLRLVTDALPILIAYVDADRRYRYVNKAYMTWYGLERGEIEGSHIRDLVGREVYRNSVGINLDKVLAGDYVQWEGWLRSPVLGPRYIHSSFVPDHDENGQVRGFVIGVTDTTGHRKAEEDQQRSKQLLLAVVENVPLGITIKDAEGRYMLANPMAQEIPNLDGDGRVGEDATGEGMLEDAEMLLPIDQEVMRTSRQITREVSVPSNSDMSHFLVTKFPVMDSAGDVFGVGTVATDITAHRAAEEDQERSKHLLHAVMENVPLGVTIKDVEGRYILANPKAREILGLGEEEMIGKIATEIEMDEAAQSLMPIDDQVMNSHRPVTREVSMPVNSVMTHMLNTKFPIMDSEGGVFGVGTVATDITAQKDAEQALKDSENRLREVLENQTHLIGRVDLDRNFSFVNDAICHLHGKSPFELIGTPFIDDRIPAVYRADILHLFDNLSIDNPTGEIENPLRDHEGKLHWFHFVHKALFNESGEIVEYQFSGQDITERKLAEEAQREAEERLRLIMDAIPILIGYVGSDLRYRVANRAYKSWFGQGRSEVLGRHMSDVIGKASFDMLHAEIEVARAGQQVTYEKRMPYRGVGERYVQGTFVPHREKDDQLAGFFTVVTDITKVKEAEEALRQSEGRLRAVIDSQIDLVGRWLPDGTRTFANDALCRFLGKSREEVLGKSFLPYLDEPTRRKLTERLTEGTSARSIISERSVLAANSETRQVQWIDTPIVDDSGMLTEVQSVGRDITRQKATENALRASERRLRLMTHAFPQYICYVDAGMRFQFANAAYLKFLGMPDAEIIGHDIEDVLGAAHYSKIAPYTKKVLRGRRLSFEYTTALPTDDADLRALHATFVPDVEDSGTVRGHYAIYVDVTDHRRSEEALKQAKLEAEHANVSKSRFLAAASHDLRQPLHGMRLLLHALENSPIPKRRSQALNGLNAALEVTSDLLDALLDISKLDAGVVTPDIEAVRAGDLIASMVTRFEPEADSIGVDLRSVATSLELSTDPVLVERILGNFVGNALKYANGKKVLLGCRRYGGFAEIQVWDQGSGVPKEEQERIFEEFYQFGQQRANRNKGLGLGLAIATRLSDLLGHKVRLQSRSGKGSMFAVRIPLSTPTMPPVGDGQEELPAQQD